MSGGGYTPLFQSLTTGTLCGRWPDIGLFPVILSLSDKHGIVDVTCAYIAGITGLVVEEVTACMKRFCEPDKYSRSTEAAGARLVLIDPEHRDWGWRVVNHARYRERARKTAYDAARTESGRNAERMRAARAASDDVPTCADATRAVPTRPALTRADPPSDANANADARERPRKRGSRLPEDFEPDLGYASKELPDIDGLAEADRFRDYWKAKTGPDAVKADWKATWRNWIRNCRDRGTYARVKAEGRASGLPCLNAP